MDRFLIDRPFSIRSKAHRESFHADRSASLHESSNHLHHGVAPLNAPKSQVSMKERLLDEAMARLKEILVITDEWTEGNSIF